MIDKCPHHHPDPRAAPPPMASAPESGRKFWRSLEELSGTPEFEQYLHREFPAAASVWNEGVSRRKFLALMGASIALLGLDGCYRKPSEKIVPYVIQPEQLVPGNVLRYATAMPLNGYGWGMLVEQQMGRPIKVDGNVNHPATLGGTNLFMQAAPLGLCDPDRSQAPVSRGSVASWSSFENDFRRTVERFGGPKKVRIRLLTEPVTSPTLYAQIQKLRQMYPQLKWHQWAPFTHARTRRGARLALGRDVQVVYDFSKASRILSLDSNFLFDNPGSVRYAYEFARHRTVRWKPTGLNVHHETPRAQSDEVFEEITEPVPTPASMNRLYVIESDYSITGAKADHRLAVRGSDVEPLARAVAGELAQKPQALPAHLRQHEAFVRAVAADLKEHAGDCMVVVGESQPPSVHALAHAMNDALGNVGKSISYLEPVEAEPVEPVESLKDLIAAMNAREVDILIMVGGNPVFDAPADLGFADALYDPKSGPRVTLSAHLSLYLDETSYYCHWQLPESHFLEMWGDVRGVDGTVSLIQPLIAPLYGSRSANELFAAMLNQTDLSSYQALRQFWAAKWHGNFEQQWDKSLRAGVIEGTASPVARARPTKKLAQWLDERTATSSPATAPTEALELNFRPDPSIYDGRFANLGWLQECPKPISKMTWDNPVLINPKTAVKLGLAPQIHPQNANGGWVDLHANGRKLRMPLWLLPGIPEDTVTIYCGYGRNRVGRVGNGMGFDSYQLRTSDSLYWAPLKIEKVPSEALYQLACTQHHQLMHGRDPVRLSSIGEVREEIRTNAPADSGIHLDGVEVVNGRTIHLSIYPEYEYRGYRWGMVVDQTACIGCNACLIACQSENNVPTVGKDQVLMFREMQWIRIDTYFTTTVKDVREEESAVMIAANGEAVFQPMFCQQCEKAPCELVCPVGATTHSAEGINEMTYNRCVGTRYCSNNCPYKVRRFNFFRYASIEPSMSIMRNPEVSVRTRGVMEKCNYCLQRIDRERTEKKIAWVQADAGGAPVTMRAIAPGLRGYVKELPAATQMTACQQACPTEALIFGDINDANSFVYRLKYSPAYKHIHYGVLTELNTQPRTSYLNRLSNPNPALTHLSPSPGTPAEGRGEGTDRNHAKPSPNPLPDYRERALSRGPLKHHTTQANAAAPGKTKGGGT